MLLDLALLISWAFLQICELYFLPLHFICPLNKVTSSYFPFQWLWGVGGQVICIYIICVTGLLSPLDNQEVLLLDSRLLYPSPTSH